jgi:serine/threonine protein kinase/Tol biopolymer transport system component
MGDERWQQIEELFHRAADLGPNQRARFLTEVCGGDEALKREIEALAAHDDSTNDVLGMAVERAVELLPDGTADEPDMLGKQIGAYQITAIIGKGGMGRVFKARDTQLNRWVALKVLPASYFSDAERKRRFLEEAKSASALSHPNIITIHGILKHGGTDFIAMEYLDGETLDRLIAHKGLPLKQAVKYAIEIADGLTAAHRAGIVHRDIKPSNIMVSGQGRVKILDFGVAKQLQQGESQDASMPGDAPLTNPGLVIGTAAYISPEQAEGKRVDARSDIFSFGALLYEMVTGRRAFQGQSTVSILAAILNQQPVTPRVLVETLPPELEKTILRCLKKDPEQRFQHMGDVKLSLEEVLEELEAPPVSSRAQKRAGRAWFIPAICVAAVALLLGAWLGRRTLPKNQITMQRLTFRKGDLLGARFGPGGTIIYAAEWDGAPSTIFSEQLGNREARNLGLPSGNIMSVSRDGNLAILIGAGNPSTEGVLAEVPIGGGVPHQILENVSAADWDRTGESIAAVRTVAGHHRIEYPIGTVLYDTQSARAPMSLRISPKNGLLAFFERTDAGDFAVELVGPRHPKQVLSTGWRFAGGLQWAPNGREVWFSGARTGADPALYSVDLGGHERMLLQIGSSPVLHDIGTDGRLLLSSVDSRIGIRSLLRDNGIERELGWFDASAVMGISDDGKTILFLELSYGKGRSPAIYLRQTNGSPAVRLGYGTQAVLSPDSRWVACLQEETGTSRLVVLPTGPGEPQTLALGAIRAEKFEWFPDSNQILLIGSEPNQPPRTYLLHISGKKPTPITPPGVRATRVSPDGRAVVVITAGTICIRSLATGEQTPLGPIEAGDSVIAWSADGRYLFIQHNTSENRSTRIFRMDVHSGKKELWRELRPADPGAYIFGQVYLTPDATSYAFSYQRDLETLYLVQGVT